MINFVCWPTHDIPRSNETAREWMRMGWKVAVAIDAKILPEWAVNPGTVISHIPPVRIGTYEGYYPAVNFLARAICLHYRADIVVAGADNILPDPEARAVVVGGAFAEKFPTGMGVMQPVRDTYEVHQRGDAAREYMPGRLMHATPSTAERCESPVLGRAWILQMYGGKGPYPEKYHQYFGDVELHEVASRMGVLCKSPVLVHPRKHWARRDGPSMEPYQAGNFDRWYEKDYAMYRARRYKDFPESEPSGISKPGANGIIAPTKRIWTP